MSSDQNGQLNGKHDPENQQNQASPDQNGHLSAEEAIAQAEIGKLLSTVQSPKDIKSLSIKELNQLAAEIRQAICSQVSKTGGHLAPNLGVVELSIAMHYVFDFDSDRLLFDVGHQCYPHKLLTGRQNLLGKLRQRGGMAGFPDPEESKYDLFSVGHAGTAISTAVGMAKADQMQGEEHRKSVAIIGDASIVNGLAMEGLNAAGTLDRQFLVVLNDNGMSIAKPQGAMSHYFDKIRVNSHYTDLKEQAHKLLDHIPGGSRIEDLYHRMSEMAKAAIYDGHMFEQFGLLCLGPVDGHDLSSLIDIMQEVSEINKPILLHCKTIKGKGFEFSSGDPTTFHSPKPFRVEGCRVELKSSGRSFTSAFSDAMIDVMKADEKVVALTAAMPDGTGLAKVMSEFPERTLDTGICESHAMDMCAGMAKSGMKPFFAVYSTFSQRALDQVFQEVSLQGLPVRVCMDRAGFVGGDGAVHHGFMDVSMFRVFPDAVLLAASDEENLNLALKFMLGYDKGASLLRYPRDNVAANPLQETPPVFELGKANLVRAAKSDKPDISILAYGTEVYEANQAMDELIQQGYDIALYDARFAKPLDTELIEKLIKDGQTILTVEDHTYAGGFGSAVLEACNDMRLSTEKVYRLAMPERWFKQDSRASQLSDAGLDAAGIARAVRSILDTGELIRPTAEATSDSSSKITA